MKLKMSVIFVSLIAIIQVALLSIMVVQDGFSSLILALFVVSLASSAFFIVLICLPPHKKGLTFIVISNKFT